MRNSSVARWAGVVRDQWPNACCAAFTALPTCAVGRIDDAFLLAFAVDKLTVNELLTGQT
jgi:hypothetical protein